MDKQIYAALEISEHEVRLVIGEFFNTRFNIIKVERVSCNAFNGTNVIKEEIIKSVKKAVENASKSIGANIEKVILAIPSINFKRLPLKVRVEVEGVVAIEDVKEAVKKATSTKIDNNLALIQAVCIKYTVNGISSRRIPINERCNELLVNIDLLCADRKVAFDIVSSVTEANLEIMDIYLDTYATCKEAALFEQTVDQNVILLKVENNNTTLSLLSQGKIHSIDRINMGLSDIVESLINKYEFPIDAAVNLVKYNARMNLKTYSKNPIYIWSKNNETKTINEMELCDTIKQSVEQWLDLVSSMCQPILQVSKPTVIITGEGGEMQGLDNLLSDKLNIEVKSYSPETLGGRRSSLTSTLGLFYAYKDQQVITGNSSNSVNMDQFEKTITYKNGNKSNPEESITKKLKGMLFEARK